MALFVDTIECNVICVLCSVCRDLNILRKLYDTLLIDECAQATEPACVGVAWRASQVVLCGDHAQLPPSTQHPWLRRSLLERMSTVPGLVVTVLDTQYRMLPEIAQWPSEYFYEASLKSFRPACSTESLVPGFAWPSRKPVAFVHVQGREMSEGTSRKNKAEVEKILQLVDGFVKRGRVPATDIGVITPYSAQRNELIRKLPRECVVGSVDAFQGREQRLVIVSLVRSNDDYAYGFFSEARRLNVAVTRAQDGLIVVGNGPFWYWATDSSHSLVKHLWNEYSFVGECESWYAARPPQKQHVVKEAASQVRFTRNTFSGLRLSEADLAEVRTDVRLALVALLDDPSFVKAWPHVMCLPAHIDGV